VPLAPYRIGEDFEQAADAFPAMSFEIVHGGMAFVEETAMAIGRFPNVYANLETTTAMLYQAPGRFAAALALLLQWGGPEKIVWSTGCTVTHPQHLLDLFWNFRFDAATLDRHGLPQIDDGVKRLILSGNYARLAAWTSSPGRIANAVTGGNATLARPSRPVEHLGRGHHPRALSMRDLLAEVRAACALIHDPCSVAAGRPTSITDMGPRPRRRPT
jgi:hypothetical protein